MLVFLRSKLRWFVKKSSSTRSLGRHRDPSAWRALLPVHAQRRLASQAASEQHA